MEMNLGETFLSKPDSARLTRIVDIPPGLAAMLEQSFMTKLFTNFSNFKKMCEPPVMISSYEKANKNRFSK
ncbi:MAG: hypothetical protein ACYTXE_42515 [Nostoc sp.]